MVEVYTQGVYQTLKENVLEIVNESSPKQHMSSNYIITIKWY